jgi:hypothetical protein
MAPPLPVAPLPPFELLPDEPEAPPPDAPPDPRALLPPAPPLLSVFESLEHAAHATTNIATAPLLHHLAARIIGPPSPIPA